MPYSVQIKFFTNTKHVLYINSIIDSYEGIGLVRTIDKAKGFLTIYSTDGMFNEVLNVLNSLKEEGIPINNIKVEETEEVEGAKDGFSN